MVFYCNSLTEGIVGDLRGVIPAMIKAFKERE